MGPDYQDVNASAYGPVSKGHAVYAHAVILTMSTITIFIVGYIGLYMFWPYVVPTLIIGLVPLGFWACARYGTNNSLLHRRPITRNERKIIRRRLSR